MTKSARIPSDDLGAWGETRFASLFAAASLISNKADRDKMRWDYLARRRVSACFVALERTTGKIAGYYTLAMSSLRLSDLPEATARRLPRYPSVPTARLGRLAVDQSFRGRGLGGALLWDATQRAAAAEIAAFALLVDAKDDGAAAFYRHHGFLSLGGNEHALFLPLTKPSASG